MNPLKILPAFTLLLPVLADADMTSGSWFNRTDVEILRLHDDDSWELNTRYLGGPDFHKLLIDMESAVADDRLEDLDMDIFYARPFGRYGLWKGGINYRYRPAADTRLGAGVEYLFPYFIDTDLVFYQSDDHAELNLEIERKFMLTNRWALLLGIETLWSSNEVEQQELGEGWNSIERRASLYYFHNPQLKLFLEYRVEQLWDDRKDIARDDNEHTREEGVYLGMEVMF
ncbi:MAG: copper resistance protein B [Porticoccaceae bacterium]